MQTSLRNSHGNWESEESSSVRMSETTVEQIQEESVGYIDFDWQHLKAK